MEFAQFMDEHPTVFHFTRGVAAQLSDAGYVEISERDPPRVERGGKYFVRRNDSNLIAFSVGQNFVAGEDGFAIVASHIDANRIAVKPTSIEADALGFVRVGAAAYGDGMNHTWWNRDLGLGGRVVVRTKSGVSSRLVRLPGVVGSVPSLAPHFGAIAAPARANAETNMVPIVGADADAGHTGTVPSPAPLASKHPPQLLRAVAREAGCSVENLLEVELEFFSAEKAAIGGLDGDLLYCGRLDDKLCSYTAIQGLLASDDDDAERRRQGVDAASDHVVRMVALYDDEEIGSLSRTGGYNKLMEVTMGLIFESLGATRDERAQSAANSIALSADVTHAANPNYLDAYSEGHMPLLNTGMAVKQLGRFTSNSVDAAICGLVSERARLPLQRFAPRNDTASGGTIGPMRAASLGIRTIDVGIPVLAMHSVREITGARDIALGSRWFTTFFNMGNKLTHGDDVYL